MRNFFCLTTATLILLGCDWSATSQNNNDQKKQEQPKTDVVTDAKVNQRNPVQASNFFTLSDAEKILGEPAHLTDSTVKIDGGTSTYSCAYTANSKDEKTGKTGAVYFLFEQYAQASSAEKVYSSIKTANENHEGIKELNDLGDEAYFHSDGENFYFILVRKGEKMFRMKVNKITSATSLDEFNLITKDITSQL